ncbi:uncharacterized protein Z520_07783 [Fonsecaea multimorphosa CBS 102226]|uniref:Uncharacterized protein n=1 Tax=Fonsecaea multimorphosa CBS 102226 TaxID=1442371 RepID=A0A0D2JSS7_9EURO|nr:uncharacterized protein Z520_07783 [Fonsecaea multimorphosa CBS 102226]KIX96517.1 hypothetical protein Z520_07783 [Fonsecaea multimorphosa CBS 102226]OAL28041.1 hypothetical protein AYO22_03068 [Fonsecaea multimorphosa]
MGVLQQTLPLSLVYFSLVSLSGLILGSIRVPYLQPLVGARYAELFEMPIMLMVIWQAAQVTVWNLDASGSKRPLASTSSVSAGKWSLLRFLTSPPPTALLIGALALVWLLAVELAVSIVAQISLHHSDGSWAWASLFVVAGRDVVAGPVYAMALLAYAVMPWIAYLVQAQQPDADKLMWDFDEKQAEQEDYCSR